MTAPKPLPDGIGPRIKVRREGEEHWVAAMIETITPYRNNLWISAEDGLNIGDGFLVDINNVRQVLLLEKIPLSETRYTAIPSDTVWEVEFTKFQVPTSISFMANGNTAVFDADGAQIPELQLSWLRLFYKWWAELPRNPHPTLGECEIFLPDGRRCQWNDLTASWEISPE